MGKLVVLADCTVLRLAVQVLQNVKELSPSQEAFSSLILFQ